MTDDEKIGLGALLLWLWLSRAQPQTETSVSFDITEPDFEGTTVQQWPPL